MTSEVAQSTKKGLATKLNMNIPNPSSSNSMIHFPNNFYLFFTSISCKGLRVKISSF